MSRKNGRNHIQSTGNFLFCLIISLALNLHELIPAVIVLILHLWIGFPPLWIVITMFSVWFFIIMIQLLVIRWASSRPTKQTGSNKNPYSSAGYVPGGNKNPYSAANHSSNDGTDISE